MPDVTRPARPDDLPALTALYNHYIENTVITFDTEPVASRDAWFAQFDASGPHRLIVAERDGRIAGYASSTCFRPKAAYASSVETTVYVDKEATGTGVGSALYAALFEALAEEDLHRALAGMTLPNDASAALHARFGFEPVGTFREVGHKFGRYWDVAWFEKSL